jgi:exosortase E/protease (VPEID-CTERM system)
LSVITKSPEAGPTHQSWLRVILAAAILLTECIWIRHTGVWTFQPFGGTANLQGLIGWLFPFLIFSFCVLIPNRRSLPPLAPAATISRWLPAGAHLLSFSLFAAVTLELCNTGHETKAAASLTIVWFLLGAASLVALGAATLPLKFLRLWDRQALLLGAAMTVASLLIFRLFQGLWNDGAAVTMHGVELVLRFLGFHVVAAGKVIGTERFPVQILPACSGYEGMGLFLAFSLAWLAWFRKEYRFPAALLLVPAGLALSWTLNVLRIAGLIIIGHFGYPKIALGGFHSQAGWIAFTLLAVAFCTLVHQIPGILTGAATRPADRHPTHDPAPSFLGPFVAMQAAAMISMAASSGVEWLYPLRVLTPTAVLLWYRREYLQAQLRPGAIAHSTAVGIVVASLWAVVAWHAAPQLRQVEVPWRAAWWFFRFAGAVIIAPLSEELAFRGYLMRRVRRPDVEKVDPRRCGWLGPVLSSIAFGLLHGSRWMEGIGAGLLYSHVYARRGRLGDAILAHSVTNLVLMTTVFYTGDWRFW